MIHLHGIPNCDTVRKARAWLDQRGTAYAFHDFKKEGADPGTLRGWTRAVGWERLLNRQGTTFRKLAPEQKGNLDSEKAIRLMAAQPSCIKRPVIEHPGGVLVGFDPAAWAEVLV